MNLYILSSILICLASCIKHHLGGVMTDKNQGIITTRRENDILFFVYGKKDILRVSVTSSDVIIKPVDLKAAASQTFHHQYRTQFWYSPHGKDTEYKQYEYTGTDTIIDHPVRDEKKNSLAAILISFFRGNVEELFRIPVSKPAKGVRPEILVKGEDHLSSATICLQDSILECREKEYIKLMLDGDHLTLRGSLDRIVALKDSDGNILFPLPPAEQKEEVKVEPKKKTTLERILSVRKETKTVPVEDKTPRIKLNEQGKQSLYLEVKAIKGEKPTGLEELKTYIICIEGEKST